MLREIGAVVALMVLTGCSIKQVVDPAKLSPSLAPEICMISSPGVRQGFTEAYSRSLQRKGFTIRVLPAGSSPSICPLSTSYIGTWKWDLALYMRNADIEVFENGRRVGRATYDASNGSGRLDKFIDAESKINELTDQLFPVGASGLGQLPDTTKSPHEAEGASTKAEQLRELMNAPVSYEEYQRRYQEIMGR